VNIEEQKQNLLTVRWSVIVQASMMPRVDAASCASNNLNKYYMDLVDEEPRASDFSGKKKGWTKRKRATLDITVDEDAESSSDDSAAGSSESSSSDSSDNE
jgi:hypothetical protein